MQLRHHRRRPVSPALRFVGPRRGDVPRLLRFVELGVDVVEPHFHLGLSTAQLIELGLTLQSGGGCVVDGAPRRLQVRPRCREVSLRLVQVRPRGLEGQPTLLLQLLLLFLQEGLLRLHRLELLPRGRHRLLQVHLQEGRRQHCC